MKNFGEIKTRFELASFLGVSVKALTHILYVKKPESYYHTFEIPKKAGGVRTISAPVDILKRLQAKLAKALVDYQAGYINNQTQKQTNISHGFEKNKSIITNARIHRNKRYVVNLDLENFFDTFHIGRVIGYFEKNRYFLFPHEVAATIGQLTCYKGKLPQGAPSSPIITNLICQILDFRLLSVAKKFKMDYTRYADDLTFSTNNKNFPLCQNDFLSEVIATIDKSGFAINEKKTRIQYRDSRQEVTGLIVNKKLGVNQSYVRKTRAMAHELYKTGNFTIDGVPGNLSQLEGRFTFINQIDDYNRSQSYAGNKEKNIKNNYDYNTRENQYRRFLFYKYFFANDRPLIVTEGITDILYLKAALKKLHEQYPQLVEKGTDGKFRFKVSFLSKTKRLNYFLHISPDGADTMGNIYKCFTEKEGNTRTPNYFRYFTETYNCKQKNPIILLFDNEDGSGNGTNNKEKKKKKPLANFLNNVFKFKDSEEGKLKKYLQDNLNLKLVATSKLFLVTNSLIGGKSECEIEDLFTEETLATILNGKTFDRNPDADNSQHYGKRKFAEYIYAHYKEIDFNNFIQLLDAIHKIVVDEGS